MRGHTYYEGKNQRSSYETATFRLSSFLKWLGTYTNATDALYFVTESRPNTTVFRDSEVELSLLHHQQSSSQQTVHFLKPQLLGKHQTYINGFITYNSKLSNVSRYLKY